MPMGMAKAGDRVKQGVGEGGVGVYTAVSAVSDASTEIGPSSRLLRRFLKNCKNPKRLSLAMNAT